MRSNSQLDDFRHAEFLDVRNTCILCRICGSLKAPEGENGERDLVVVFRGTQAKAEWISNIVCDMVEWSELQTYGPTIKVERVRTLQGLLMVLS